MVEDKANTGNKSSFCFFCVRSTHDGHVILNAVKDLTTPIEERGRTILNPNNMQRAHSLALVMLRSFAWLRMTFRK